MLGEDGTDAYLERGPEDAELDERHGGERCDDDVELGVRSKGGEGGEGRWRRWREQGAVCKVGWAPERGLLECSDGRDRRRNAVAARHC